MTTSLRSSALPSTLLVLAACSSGGEEENPAFQVRSTNVAAASNTPVLVSGAFIAFLAAEDATGPGGTNLNGDGDLADRVAHVVNTSANTQFRLGVAADNLAWAGAELYLAVDEGRDGRSWNPPDIDTTDSVLLHWSEATNVLTFVDLLASSTGTPMVGLNNRLLYAADVGGMGIGDTTLRFIEAAAPTTLIAIGTTGTVGPLSPLILGEDEGLVFLALDETALGGGDVNGDGDPDDTRVLALLDGTANTSLVRSTGLAVREDEQPIFRADAGVAGDWRVAFLVSEADQGAASLNRPNLFGGSFRPVHCAGDDMDVLDQVLHVLSFAAWDADPLANPPLNHGLPGRERIAFTATHVATIVAETDDGCDLNNDGNMTDRVVRWMPVADDAGDLFLPVNTATQLKALADVPGGGHGLHELSGQFVIVASEAQGGDIDVNNGLDSDLILRLAPSVTSTWSFLHGALNDTPISTTWVSPRENEGYLGVASEERLANVPLNPGDNDVNDSLPAFANFSGGLLRFPFVRFALDRDSAGIVVTGNIGFWRLSEAEDNRDLNSDGDMADFLLARTHFSNGATIGMSVASDLQRGVIELGRHGTPFCAAFLASEAQQGAAGTDYNGDGDGADLVLRWFRL